MSTRVLLATGSPAGYMLPPRLGDEQVVCGPDWPDERSDDGRVRSLSTSVGSYDLAAVAARLPPEQQPDVVVCLVDAAWRNLPRNLGAFSCPRVLLVADTHHLNDPLMGMLRYLIGEPYDRVVLLYDRHHARLFAAAGVKNLFWFPGLTFPHSDALVQAARRPGDARTARVAFVGQAGRFHPRRTALLQGLSNAGLPVAVHPLPQRAAATLYGSSLLGFNASLNGDLNLRVFEILAAGAGLLTDRLAPASGLSDLFSEGREVVTYGDGAELNEEARALIEDPRRAAALGAAGAAWFDAHLGEAKRQADFRALAFDGVHPSSFPLPADLHQRLHFGGDTDRLLQGIMVYEALQELHRQQESVRVLLEPEAPADLAELCATLPRVELTSIPGGADLAIYRAARAEEAARAGAASIWCWDAGPGDLAALVGGLGPAGFAPASPEVALFSRAEPAEMLAQARLLWDRGQQPAAFELARAAMERDPGSADACLLVAEMAVAHGAAPLADKMYRRALELRPGDPAIERALARTSSPAPGS